MIHLFQNGQQSEKKKKQKKIIDDTRDIFKD